MSFYGRQELNVLSGGIWFGCDIFFWKVRNGKFFNKKKAIWEKTVEFTKARIAFWINACMFGVWDFMAVFRLRIHGEIYHGKHILGGCYISFITLF